jgi:hypothetical protein
MRILAEFLKSPQIAMLHSSKDDILSHKLQEDTLKTVKIGVILGKPASIN